MGISEFRGPGFSEAQWDQIRSLADSLDAKQLTWLSGFFAGIEHQAKSALFGQATPVSAPASTQNRTLTVLYGSETGNSATLAGALSERLAGAGRAARVLDMAAYKTRELKDEQDLLVVTATHGEGDPPASAAGFFEFVEGRKAPKLAGLRYAVLGLGDSTYEFFCGAARRLDARLAELGAARMRERVDCDVDYDAPFADWMSAMVAELAAQDVAKRPAIVAEPRHAAANAPAFDKRNPFPATVIDNIALTGRGSSKETRHLELSLEGSGLAFRPGDALGVMPRNDPVLVERLLATLELDPEDAVTVKERWLSLRDALGEMFEITAATPRFLSHWAHVTGSDELKKLRDDNTTDSRADYLRGHHILDIVRRFPAPGVDAATFLAGLRPLQPRLYSIASSPDFAPDEAHLTVSVVRYALNNEPRDGVASSHLAARCDAGATAPVYIQANPHFRLAESDAPILMIGAGTGVAPYRAFLQEREARGVGGRSWLFFGERNFDSDFLYQTEWRDFLKSGALTRMNVAFSRDSATKTYVQHRLLEHARDVHAWLEEGAHVYVCGDGAKLAPDVHAALMTIVQKQAGRSKADAHDYLSAMQAAHRYHVDVY
ncbi:MAG TPA: assimilatory sulfite reductase (NADPH) flavoprotein subunit [Roseiarcus sp.]|nr:assimilatory sulfite reductase (NADPH) flavoprotein subunit [Roseiarcus sp.]